MDLKCIAFIFMATLATLSFTLASTAGEWCISPGKKQHCVRDDNEEKTIPIYIRSYTTSDLQMRDVTWAHVRIIALVLRVVVTLVHALIYVAVMVATVTCPASLHLEKALIVLPAWEEVANCQRTRCLKRKKKEVPFVEGLLRQRPVMQMILFHF